MASQKAGDLGSTEERHNKSFDISPRTPERKENTLFSASIPTDSENMHDGAIIEDPRFRGYEEQVTKSKVMEISVFSQGALFHNSHITHESIDKNNLTNTSKLMRSVEKRGKHTRTKSPMIEDVYSTQKEIQQLTEDDILNFNFLQNLLELIDSEEFFVDSITSQENLISHIIYNSKNKLNIKMDIEVR